MKRTVTALYETGEEAERVRDALTAAHLGAEVEICDQTHEEGKRHHRGLIGWLSDVFSGHDDHHLYAEGLRRGHVLLTAKVDDLNETRAAVIMDAAAMNLVAAEQTWQGEGWKPEAPKSEGGTGGEPHPHHHRTPIDISGAGSDRGPYASTPGSGVRAYTL